MIPAEHEEQGSLLVVELEGALAVEMNDLVGVERDGIAGRDRLYASRTFRVRHRSHLVDLHDSARAGLVNDLFDQFACDQWRSDGLIRRRDVLFRHRRAWTYGRLRWPLGALCLPQMEDVARRVGYSSAANFSRAFNEVMGIRPGEYRARRRHHDD